MKLIIAGGRDYERLTAADLAALERLRPQVEEVITGGCRGADHLGERWALERGIPATRFNADWDTNGRAAGPIRNAQMAAYADAVFLLPGGRGTASMRAEAEKAGLEIYEA